MDYLGRDGAPLDSATWEKLDAMVVQTASRVLTGRRLIALKGPIGSGLQMAKIDRAGHTEEFEDGFVKTTGRQLVEVPQLYSDFWLYWRDLEGVAMAGADPSFATAAYAATKLARQEDSMIFYGIPALGLEGLLTAKGAQTLKRGDWSTGEAAFTDIAAAMTKLEQNGFMEAPALVVSPDVYLQLQRIQPGTGVIEVERIQAMLGRKIYKSIALKEGTAALFCPAPYCMDLLVGQDIRTAYLEAVDMNHHFRIMETILLRVLCPNSIVVFQ